MGICSGADAAAVAADEGAAVVAVADEVAVVDVALAISSHGNERSTRKGFSKFRTTEYFYRT